MQAVKSFYHFRKMRSWEATVVKNAPRKPGFRAAVSSMNENIPWSIVGFAALVFGFFGGDMYYGVMQGIKPKSGMDEEDIKKIKEKKTSESQQWQKAELEAYGRRNADRKTFRQEEVAAAKAELEARNRS